MAKKNVLLLCGGGGTEHDISLVSMGHIKNTLATLPQYEFRVLEIKKDGSWVGDGGQVYELGPRRPGAVLIGPSDEWKVDFVIPCIHGPPGETGDLQSYLEILGVPYMGVGPEASKLCFNKISSKLWFSALGIPNTPYLFLSDPSDLATGVQKVKAFHKEHGALFVKASSQGSSVGCYPLDQVEDAQKVLTQAFKLSPYVLVERKVVPRELEVSAYEYDGKLVVTYPGEIKAPGFYSFEEKYDKKSRATTDVRAQDLPEALAERIKALARTAFLGLKLRHLSRIDFFLTKEGELYLNEINTFPGMTPISMFPKMMEENGHKFRDFLAQVIDKETSQATLYN